LRRFAPSDASREQEPDIGAVRRRKRPRRQPYRPRFLKRYVDEHRKLPITTMLKAGSKFKVDVENNEVVAQIVDENEGSVANN
jgi:hypothetical protein